MQLRFLGQPFPQSGQIGEVLRQALRSPTATSAWFATAWGKRSGLSRLASDLESFRGRGGTAEAILGVDMGGATKEGLELAVDLFDAAYVFHDPAARTFHPKLYVVEGQEGATAIVGSGNFTSGGLFSNYEAALVAELDFGEAGDVALYDEISFFYESLLAESDACRRLDAAFLLALQQDPGVAIVSEQQAGRERTKQRRAKSGIFESAVAGLLSAPAAPSGFSDEASETDDAGSGTTTSDKEPKPGNDGGAAPKPAPLRRPVLRWWKRLSVSDAHRKPSGSNQRNYVTLNQARHNIPWDTWFREELFGDLDWTQVPMKGGAKTKDLAEVEFEVFVDGAHLGPYSLYVDHSADRAANQNNTPTYLNWSTLMPVVLERDLTDWWIELARLSDGTYRLQLTPDEPTT